MQIDLSQLLPGKGEGLPQQLALSTRPSADGMHAQPGSQQGCACCVCMSGAHAVNICGQGDCSSGASGHLAIGHGSSCLE